MTRCCRRRVSVAFSFFPNSDEQTGRLLLKACVRGFDNGALQTSAIVCLLNSGAYCFQWAVYAATRI